MRVLIAAGANLELEREGAGTPLLVAAALNHVDIVGLLIEASAVIEARVGDDTALAIAAKKGHLKIVTQVGGGGQEGGG